MSIKLRRYQRLTAIGYKRYKIDKKGAIKSLRKNGTWERMRPGDNGSGHRYVRLWKDGKSKLYYVHCLVLTIFKEPCPKGMECRHLNGDPSDNRLENLKWGTVKQNSRDRIRHGTMKYGEKNWNSKLTKEDVLYIRKTYCPIKRNGKKLAKRFDVSQQQISRITTGIRWKHYE